jgi:mono/diheme cytochrome c family protein
VFFSACGRTSEVDLASVERRGEVLFRRQRCLGCHVYGFLYVGDEATRPVPDLRKTPTRTRDWYVAYFLEPKALRPRSPMFSLRYLPQEDLEALIAYVQRLSRDVQAPPPEPLRREDVPVVPEGFETYRAGGAIYARYCSGCHGEMGNGAGPVGHLLSPEPRDFTDPAWMAHASDLYLYSVITNGKAGTAMPAFGSVLSPEERARVLRYVRFFPDPVARERMEQGFLPPSAETTTAVLGRPTAGRSG